MDVQKKAKICATLFMIFFIMLILEPIIFDTCFLLMVLFIVMAIGLIMLLWSLLRYIFSEIFSNKDYLKEI